MAHAKELNNEVPDEPIIFMKPPTSLLINDRPFYYPDFSNDIHYEVELVLRVVKNGKRVQPEFASEYYSEIALGIDFTARDLQQQCKEKGLPWEIAKGFDYSAPISSFFPIDPWLKAPIPFRLDKNGETVQQVDSSLMIFPFDDLIVHISKYFKLQIGDYIFTGTPEGVGPIRPGDLLEGYLGDERVLRCEIR